MTDNKKGNMTDAPADNIPEIGMHLVSIRNVFVKIFNKMLRGDEKISEMPITISQLRTLSAFHEDREYSMGELSSQAMVTMPSMTEMVDKLEASKLMKRIRDTEDRRVVKVALTKHGKKIHQEFVGKRRAELYNLLNKLEQQDRDELLQSLKKVSTILEKLTT